MSSEQYELIFKGPKETASAEEIRDLKRTLVSEFQFPIDKVREFFENAPIAIVRSTSEDELQLYCRTLNISGAEVAVVKVDANANADESMDDSIEMISTTEVIESHTHENLEEETFAADNDIEAGQTVTSMAESSDDDLTLDLGDLRIIEPADKAEEENNLLENALQSLADAPDWSLEIPEERMGSEKLYGAVITPNENLSDLELEDESPVKEGSHDNEQSIQSENNWQEQTALESNDITTGDVSNEHQLEQGSDNQDGSAVSFAVQDRSEQSHTTIPEASDVSIVPEKSVLLTATHTQYTKKDIDEQDQDVEEIDTQEETDIDEQPLKSVKKRSVSPLLLGILVGTVGFGVLYYYHFIHTQPVPVILQSLPPTLMQSKQNSSITQKLERRRYQSLVRIDEMSTLNVEVEIIGTRPVRLSMLMEQLAPEPLTPLQIVRGEAAPIWIQRIEVDQGAGSWSNKERNWITEPRAVAFLEQGELRRRIALKASVSMSVKNDVLSGDLLIHSQFADSEKQVTGVQAIGNSLDNPMVRGTFTFELDKFVVVEQDTQAAETATSNKLIAKKP